MKFALPVNTYLTAFRIDYVYFTFLLIIKEEIQRCIWRP